MQSKPLWVLISKADKKIGGETLKKLFFRSCIITCIIVLGFVLLHSSPYIALRTHVFMMGYPVIAVTTGFVEDKLHNSIDPRVLKGDTVDYYTLTKPAFEKETGGTLANYRVIKKGFLYFADYCGEA